MSLGAVVLAATLLGATALRAGDDVPFKGEATSQYVGEDQDGIYVTTYWKIVGGNLTHLGKVTGSAEVYWMQVNVAPPIYVPLGASITLVAADGDEVHLSQAPGTFDPNTLTVYSTYEITGGTGRFAGATGSGESTASGYSTVKNTWNGTIDYKKK
jgi:hypothetical protein